MTTAPKVFLSHASEDKERFVLDFATRLRRRGIDAWLDKWEMLPGDSLVEKIFDEGLKEAAAVIIVLSANSVEKKWVREELNASIVAKIAHGTKIIPVVLDGCDVPEPLKATVWASISDLQNYDESLDRITAAVFGETLRPPLGNSPRYTQQTLAMMSGLEHIDNLVLKLSCEFLIQQNELTVDPNLVFNVERNVDIPLQEVLDSIEVLGKAQVFRVTYHSGNGVNPFACFYQVSPFGMEKYAQAYIPDYSKIVDNLTSLIVNEQVHTNSELQAKLAQPPRLVDHVLLWWEDRGLITLEKFIDRGILISHVSATLRRSLR